VYKIKEDFLSYNNYLRKKLKILIKKKKKKKKKKVLGRTDKINILIEKY